MPCSLEPTEPGKRSGVQDGDSTPARMSPASAPWYRIPDTSIVSVEHPYAIRDLDGAVKLLGGYEMLHEVRNACVVDRSC